MVGLLGDSVVVLFDIFNTVDIDFREGAHELYVLSPDVFIDAFELINFPAVSFLLRSELVYFLIFMFGVELFELFDLVRFSHQLHLQLTKLGLLFSQLLVQFLYSVFKRLYLFLFLSHQTVVPLCSVPALQLTP